MILEASLVGEALQDDAIVRVYGSGSASGEASAAAPIPLPPGLPFQLEGGLTVGYRRIGGDQVGPDGAPTGTAAWIWYAPIAVHAGPLVPMGVVDLAFSVGPTWVPWAELPAEDAASSGVKLGGLAQAEARVHLRKVGTGLFGEDPTRPDVLLTFGGGARVHHLFCPDSCGLDFGSVRLQAGVGIALP